MQFRKMFRIPLCESLVLLRQQKNQEFLHVINILIVMHQFLKTYRIGIDGRLLHSCYDSFVLQIVNFRC